MTILLDTHVWLWMLTEPTRLGRLRARLEDPANELLLSAASTWEIAIKAGLGRLDVPRPLDDYLADRIRSTSVTPLAIGHSHTAAVANLPDHHRDPFDRLLIAQARIEDVPIATADKIFGRYGIKVLTP